MKSIGPRLSEHPAGARNVPQPPAPLGCALGESTWGEAGQWKWARIGVGSGGRLGAVPRTFELKKGDLGWGFRAPEMETEKGDS